MRHRIGEGGRGVRSEEILGTNIYYYWEYHLSGRSRGGKKVGDPQSTGQA